MKSIYLVLFLMVFFPVDVFSSGAIQAREQMKQKIIQQRQAAMSQQNEAQGGLVSAESSQKRNQYDEIVSLQDIWREMEISSEIWMEMIDRQPKIETVKKYVDYFQGKQILIRKDPAHYVGMIDLMSNQSPEMLKQPFWVILRMVAIMEYDFDNGVDPDVLARKALGKSLYEKNKMRLQK